MPKLARLYPYEYVNQLRSLTVPGYSGYPGGVVAVTRYVSANTLFGGASRSATLQAALAKAATDPADLARLGTAAMARVFTGQGMPEDIIATLAMVDRYHDTLSANRTLAPYLAQTDYLQALCDASFIGQDCIGFVGTYLAAAGVDNGYQGGRPLDYTGRFPLVHSLLEVRPMSILLLTSGMHIQLVDWIREQSATRIVCDIAQSSNLDGVEASRGPQCNERVTISAGGGAYLPVEEFRNAKDKRTRWDEYLKTNPQPGPTPNGYEMYLRKVMTVPNRISGYLGGSIFTLSGGGNPANPTAGPVYIGRMPALEPAAAPT